MKTAQNSVTTAFTADKPQFFNFNLTLLKVNSTFITPEIGELSGAIPEIFEEYFPIVMKSWPVLQNAELKLYPMKSEGLCLSCNAMYPLLRYNGKCPKCGSDRYRILGGTDIIIKNIAYDCQDQ